LEFDFSKLKGMSKALNTLTRTLKYGMPEEPILVVGQSGTGKTSILNALSDSNWPTFRITSSNTSSSDAKIRATLSIFFAEARQMAPAIVLIDNLDTLVPRDASEGLASALGEEIRSDLNKNIRIVASAKRQPDLHPSFAWTFRSVVDLPVPTAATRKEILEGCCESASDEVLEHVSLRTHAFVPGDIWRLCGVAINAAMLRQSEANSQSDSLPRLSVLEEDFAVALRSVRPSAMGEVFLDVPNVHWRDVGGSENLKEELQRATSFIFDVSGSIFLCHIANMGRLLMECRPYSKKSKTAES
jgi:SpoVK/Ycf46/Vps4 family AAA+-type ATPase